MYIGALIEFPNGSRKVVESTNKHDSLAVMKFIAKIAKYAKKKNKLVKVCADDYKVFKILQKALGVSNIEYGFISGDYQRE